VLSASLRRRIDFTAVLHVSGQPSAYAAHRAVCNFHDIKTLAGACKSLPHSATPADQTDSAELTCTRWTFAYDATPRFNLDTETFILRQQETGVDVKGSTCLDTDSIARVAQSDRPSGHHTRQL